MGYSLRANGVAPSRRVVALAIGVVALVAAVIVARQPQNDAPISFFDSTTNPRNTFNEADTDSDGLHDWEEALWGLDPNSADSDGDGTTDAEYVVEERARVANVPNTILSIYNEESDPTERPESTALAGQILISQLFAAKEAGVAVPESSIRLASQVALSGVETDYTYSLYGQDAILTSTGDNVATLRAYGNAVGEALKNPSGDEAPHELFVLIGYAQTSDTVVFERDMDIVIANYDRSIANLLTVPAPSQSAALHLALINALVRVRTDLAVARDVGTNPVLALVGLDRYDKNSTTMAQLFTELRGRIAESDIEYESYESGALIMKTQ